MSRQHSRRSRVDPYADSLTFEEINDLLRRSENERANATVAWLMDLDQPKPGKPRKIRTPAQRAAALRRKKARQVAGHFSVGYLRWYVANVDRLAVAVGEGQTLPPRPKHGILSCPCGEAWVGQAHWFVGADGRGRCPLHYAEEAAAAAAARAPEVH
jgi:hypothetical protein